MSRDTALLTHAMIADIAEKARSWRPTVEREDVTRAFAANEIAGDVTHPYATAAVFAACRNHAYRLLG
jgi:hypothetical protein